MKKFTFKAQADKKQLQCRIQEGVHSANIVQVADIGEQLPFDRNDDPESQMAVAFELPDGEVVAKRMKFSEHPQSACVALFTAAFPDLTENDDQEIALSQLLGKLVLIEVEVRDGKWPRVTEIMPMEDGFDSFEPTNEMLEFDAEEMDRDVYLKLHRDIRSWVSKRVRHSS